MNGRALEDGSGNKDGVRYGNRGNRAPADPETAVRFHVRVSSPSDSTMKRTLCVGDGNHKASPDLGQCQWEHRSFLRRKRWHAAHISSRRSLVRSLWRLRKGCSFQQIMKHNPVYGM